MRTGSSGQDGERPHLVGDKHGQWKLHSQDAGYLYVENAQRTRGRHVTMLQVNQLQQSGDPRVTDNFVALVNGPSKWCQRYKIFVYYYGVLTDVFEIKYHMEHTLDVEHATGDNDEVRVRSNVDVLWVSNNNSLASMSIDEGIETQPSTFNLMEHDHIDHFTVPNNVEGVMDERQRMTRRAQPVEPPHIVARLSRFLGMLSQEASYFPINIVDWRNFYRALNMDRAWQKIKGTLDWTNAITLELEPKIRQVCKMKLNDRWKNYKANLKKAYYTPCLHSPLAERFLCNDGRVNQDQWKLLVQLWEHTINKLNGSKPDYITFFMLTHTRKNWEPVDARSVAIIDDFNTKLKLYEDRKEIITDEVHYIMYANVLGLEKNNSVRGFGTGVVWSDVPGIITEKRGICREVEAIKASYEEQRKAANIEIERLRMKACEGEEKQRIEWVDLEVENMKPEVRAEIMSTLKKTANGGMVEPNRVDVTQVCIQASGEVEDEGFVVLQNIGTDDKIGYRPCMVNVTSITSST
ncbi:hypothetical protein D8674_009791 [Pyrus ussuriensis x Pyrus communis]|uniref:Uncharacterized protein n=1 Tax=Pyrus ussuriensis x Pyrus communis TaxID=2448454 RepID=A0A5N5FED1_9ROSA|nr:hypothetical protein D8674_009791 [Pyrus ussuriensis x Pyrus communis]